jgi:hypothetical protein
MRKRISKGLEDSPEKAGSAAQQTTQDAAEAASQQTTEGAAADGRGAEAALAADVRVARHVLHRADNLERTADQAAIVRSKALNDITELVVSGQETALVTEDPAFALQQPAHKTAQQSTVDPT